MSAESHPISAARPGHRRAIVFMVIAATCWSSGGYLVRQLSITDAWEIVFWRSLFMALFVGGVLLVLHGRRMPRAIVAAGWPALVSGAFLAGTFFFFIASLTRTTVANTNVLFAENAVPGRNDDGRVTQSLGLAGESQKRFFVTGLVIAEGFHSAALAALNG